MSTVRHPSGSPAWENIDDTGPFLAAGWTVEDDPDTAPEPDATEQPAASPAKRK